MRSSTTASVLGGELSPGYRGRHPGAATARGGSAALGGAGWRGGGQGMREAVITGGARTATGRLLGSLKDFSAAQLGGIVIKAALERAGLSGDQADYVIMGQVLQAGAGQNP